MIIGVTGLGLIGGSIAKAYAEAGHTVLGYDCDAHILSFGIMSGAVKEPLTKDNIGTCDLVLIAVFPTAAAEYMAEMASFVSKSTVVMDCCGTKELVCQTGMALAQEYGYTYIGGHPMAGTHHSGFKASTPDLFRGSPMVIVPPVFDDMELLDMVSRLLEPLGFSIISVTTAAEHDRMIAFTSQAAHIVSSAYIKSPTAKTHTGFSAGSYKDMTRVALLNPDMWTELFLENSDNLINEIDTLVSELVKYRDAIKDGNRDTLRELLADGRRCKEEIDGQ